MTSTTYDNVKEKKEHILILRFADAYLCYLTLSVSRHFTTDPTTVPL